jgi:hypothetical protein
MAADTEFMKCSNASGAWRRIRTGSHRNAATILGNVTVAATVIVII